MNNEGVPVLFGLTYFEQMVLQGEWHFMVDIETLDVTPNAAITEIGAVSMAYVDATFWEECYDFRGSSSQSTIQWRIDNNLPYYIGPDKPLGTVLDKFSAWIETQAAGLKPILWCKGTDFDAVILKNAYERAGLTVPWKYNSVRDLRTLLSLYTEFNIPKDQVTHNGLEDAMKQRHQLLQIINAMEL